MKYILDFDRTLFDTDRFMAAVYADRNEELFMTPKVWERYNARDFLYSDTLDFLTSKRKDDLVILTAMKAELGETACEYQRAKLRSFRAEELVERVFFMAGDKGPHVKELYDGTQTVFVDDLLEHVRSARAHCREVTSVLITRTGAGDVDTIIEDDIPRVATLHELDAMIEHTS